MIKGITPQLAEAGKIKIGGLGETRPTKAGGTFRMPVKYSHFVITSTMRSDEGDLIPDTALMEQLDRDDDDQITALPIYLHSDVIDEVFPTAYACYVGKKLHCTGDGERAVRHELKRVNGHQERTGNIKVIDCTCSYFTDEQSKIRCKPHGTLHCSLAIPGNAVAGSVYRWRTTSMISIQRMIGSLQSIIAVAGGLRGLPLWLKLEAVKVRDGSTVVYCCHVELRAKDMAEAQQLTLRAAEMRAKIQAAPEYKALVQPPAHDDESDAEQAEVSEEFHAPEVPQGKPNENLGNGALAERLGHDPETGEVIE